MIVSSLSTLLAVASCVYVGWHKCEYLDGYEGWDIYMRV